jgi:hypothetical protein
MKELQKANFKLKSRAMRETMSEENRKRMEARRKIEKIKENLALEREIGE